jgi:hypothetical protein
MKRAMTLLGTLAAAGSIAVAVPALAHAAEGRLIINGTVYDNPQGCYDSNRWPLSVANMTAQPVVIYSGTGCSGEELRVLFPHEHTVSEFGQSVSVPDPDDGD